MYLKLHKDGDLIRIESKPFTQSKDGHYYQIAEPLRMSGKYIVKLYKQSERGEKLEKSLLQFMANSTNGQNRIEDLVYLVQGDKQELLGFVMPYSGNLDDIDDIEQSNFVKNSQLKLHSNGQVIRLEHKPFAGGGEGNLYHIASPLALSHRSIVKLYHPNKMTLARQEKLRYLLENPPTELQHGVINPSIVWVQDLVYNSHGDIVGILLPFVKGEKLELLSTLKLPKNVEPTWQRFAFGNKDALNYRMRLCFNIAAALQQVHSTGKYVLVDLKPDNIVIQSNGIISLVDLDSVEVVQEGTSLFDAPVATPEFTPPEHYISLEYDPTARQAWDRFSIAVIFYKLLFGIHPFAAGTKPPYDNCLTLEQKIEAGLFVHSPSKKEYIAVLPPPHQSFWTLPDGLRNLFLRAFEDGHNDPESRPTAEEWCVELLSAIGDPKLQALFGHLSLPDSIEEIKISRKLPSEVILIPDYKPEKAEMIIPEWWNRLELMLEIPKLTKVPDATEQVQMKRPKIPFGWMLFGFIFIIPNVLRGFSGLNIFRFVGSILHMLGEGIEEILQVFGIGDDAIVFVMIALIATIFIATRQLLRTSWYFFAKEVRAKRAIQKKLAKTYNEFGNLKTQVQHYINRINNSSASSYVDSLIAENIERVNSSREKIKKHDPKVEALIVEEKKAYIDLHEEWLAKALSNPALQGYIATSLGALRKMLTESKNDSEEWTQAKKAFDDLSKGYQEAFRKLKNHYNQLYKEILEAAQRDAQASEKEIISAESEKKANFEQEFSGKIPLKELEELQKQVQLKKTDITVLEYEKARYSEVNLKNYMKLKK